MKSMDYASYQVVILCLTVFVVNVVEVGDGCWNAVFACLVTGKWLSSLRDYIFCF